MVVMMDGWTVVWMDFSMVGQSDPERAETMVVT
jgi:hypothetical protein